MSRPRSRLARSAAKSYVSARPGLAAGSEVVSNGAVIVRLSMAVALFLAVSTSSAAQVSEPDTESRALAARFVDRLPLDEAADVAVMIIQTSLVAIAPRSREAADERSSLLAASGEASRAAALTGVREAAVDTFASLDQRELQALLDAAQTPDGLAATLDAPSVAQPFSALKRRVSSQAAAAFERDFCARIACDAYDRAVFAQFAP